MTIKEFIKDAVSHKEEGELVLNMIFVSLISYDNNRTPEEIKNNCATLSEFIDALEEYKENIKLQELRNIAIKYNEEYADILLLYSKYSPLNTTIHAPKREVDIIGNMNDLTIKL